ncbi:MAG: FliM/FliN family flagellar motor C-terminal domain-containing protein [Deltaproteobacteria bacterium]|nr:FliM/FliN family flagellar motor C-terminal domain-containing protein [Deltaproteobacteria bacterium]
MSDAALDPEELEAIQAAIRQTAPPRAAHTGPEPTGPLALIAADRDAQTARPRLLQLARDWARSLERTLRGHLNGDAELNVIDAEIIDGRALRDELRTMWKGVARPQGRPGHLVVAVGGNVIEAAAALRCGLTKAATASTRDPSLVALRLFDPVGRSLVQALGRAWRERESIDLLIDDDPAAGITELIESDLVIAATVTLNGAATGRLRLFTPPTTTLPPPESLDAVRPTAEAISAVLGEVEVELLVNLGTVEITLAQLRKLAVGATLPLTTFVDSPVPVYVGGVVKAMAKPVVSRGVLAIEIQNLTPTRGGSR